MDAPYSNRRIESEVGHIAPPHCHAQGQLAFIEHGMLSLEANGGVWAVPAGWAHWIPAGIVHASRAHGEVDFLLTHVSASFAARLPEQIRVLRASTLLIAALDRLRGLEEKAGLVEPLLDVIAHEINHAPDDAPVMLLPVTPRMRQWALAFLAAPHGKIGIDDAARAAAMSRRTFTRHFAQEVGLSFAVWKRAVIVHRAIARLAEGASVNDVAFDVGYDSVSAFIAMFRAVRGLPPGTFQQTVGA